ncbi:hypothetical protein LOTGIDRAFT_157520 [Lottia gigantea]|uniref:Uncharacterized protein n=1 Tax=Lottia gigantea TaxID=225164 RepID=V4B1V8_LOTGI|nr:hypothetical protein LOTGIDRAFT_157520 [Lottia gigantea]ESP01341.1 hypothetical protein LOTGIDRAFT_157520 [Lottia gigantea]
MADKLQLKTITVVFDLTIYAKAQEIQWTNDIFRNRLVIRLGEFHTCMSFLSIIGKRFQDAGLNDILVEAEIIASGSVNAVMEGKHYNRCMYAHKLMFEALHRLKFSFFVESFFIYREQRKDVTVP